MTGAAHRTPTPHLGLRPVASLQAMHDKAGKGGGRSPHKVVTTQPRLRSAPAQMLDRTGQKLGAFVVIGLAFDGSAKWVVRCECGNYETRKERVFSSASSSSSACHVCVRTRAVGPKMIGTLRRLRDEAIEKQGNLCWWCEKPMTHPRSKGPLQATAEHLIPRWMGGPVEPWNIKASCKQCNNARGDSIDPPPTAKKSGPKSPRAARVQRFLNQMGVKAQDHARSVPSPASAACAAAVQWTDRPGIAGSAHDRTLQASPPDAPRAQASVGR